MKALLVTAAIASIAIVGQAKTIALWPLGDNSSVAAACARCATDSGFDLNINSGDADNAMPGDWHIPPNPSTDLDDSYYAVARRSLVSTAADGNLNCGIAYVVNSTLAKYMYPTNDFTVEGWMRLDGFDTTKSTWRIIVQAGNGSGKTGGWCLSLRYNASNGYYLNLYSQNNNAQPYPTTGDVAFYNFIDGKNAVTLDDLKGKWRHYAVVFDYQDPTVGEDAYSRWRLYCYGRLVGTKQQNKYAIGYTLEGVSNRFELGGRGDSAGQRLDGAYSFWRVSDEALEPEQFLNYTAGGTKTGTKVSEYQPTWTALDLNSRESSSTRWMNTGVRLTGQAISNCTFETWINASNDSWIMSQFSTDEYRSQWKIVKWEGAYHLQFNIYDPATGWINITSERVLLLNSWHHVALVIDGDYFRFYINGILDTEECHPGMHLSNDDSAYDGVVLGNQRLWATPYGPNGSANAAFAEARVWNRARTGEEIRANLHSRLPNPENETNLIGYWPLCDGVAGENIDGLAAYNYAKLDAQSCAMYQREVGYTAYSPICAFITNGVWKSYANLAITGAVPHSVYGAFCPEGGYTNAATTDVTGQYNRFTYTAWYYFSSLSKTGSERSLMAKALSGNGRMHLREYDCGGLYLWLGGGASGATNEELRIAAANTGLHYGRWEHIAVVRAGHKISIYVNGVLRGESDAFTLDTHPSAPFQFGGFYAGGSSGIFNGLVREVGIWKTALTAEQIVDTMTKRPVGNERQLLGYWPCDDGEGNSLRNLKVDGLAATPIGASANFHWRSLATVPSYDGNIILPIPGFMLLIK